MKPQKEQCTNAINQYICQLKKGHTGNCEDHRSVSEIAMSVGAVPPSRLRPQHEHEHPEACPVCKSPYCEHSEREQNLIKAAWEAGYREPLSPQRETKLLEALHEYDILLEQLDEALASPEEIERDTKAVGGYVSGLNLTYGANTVLKKAIERLKPAAAPVEQSAPPKLYTKADCICPETMVDTNCPWCMQNDSKAATAPVQQKLEKSVFVIGVGFGYGACQLGKSETLTVQYVEEKWPKIQKEILGHLAGFAK